MTLLTVGSTARNPGYGEPRQERMRFHLASMDDFARGLGVAMEHLVVDWNPLPEPMMAADFEMFSPLHHERRSVVATGDEVDDIVTATGRPFVEQAAKQHIIDHAKGDWLLIVNSDVALSFAQGAAIGSLIASLGEADVFVRADRLDVRYEPDEDFPARVDIRDALSRASLLHRRHGLRSQDAATIPVRGLSGDEIGRLASSPRLLDVDLGPAFLCQDKAGPMKGLHTNASGDFCLTRTDLWRAAGVFPREFFGYGHGDSMMVASLAAHGVQQALLRFPLVVVHPEHDSRSAAAKYGSFDRVEQAFLDRLKLY